MRNAEQVVEQEYLQVRAKILEIAAFFDRLEAAGGVDASKSTKLQLLQSGCEILLDGQQDKAARVQLHFSRHFDPQWRQKMEV